MPVIAALRETEAWSATSVILGLVLVAVVVAYIAWRVRRFLQGR